MYRLLLINFSFVIALAVVVATFITAKNYTQLGIAIILYPLLIFAAYKAFEKKILSPPLKKPPAQVRPMVSRAEKIEDVKKESLGVSDTNKRLFLQLIGATSLSFFLISIFGRRIETLFFGQNLGTLPPLPAKTTPAPAPPTDGYSISEIDDSIVGYFGFVNKDGGWFIMKRDTEKGSFRYAKGLSNFPGNWENRQNLKYNYFHNVFVY